LRNGLDSPNVLEADEDMKNIWKVIQHVIHVERLFVMKGEETQSHHYYTSSLSSCNAELFANGI
jgi:hypothetical protein